MKMKMTSAKHSHYPQQAYTNLFFHDVLLGYGESGELGR
jgi:hypothetical protein